MNERNAFKILIVDDNPAIHRDFIKILTAAPTSDDLDELSNKMFGKKKNEDLALPDFQIDTASQGQEGVERIKNAFAQNQPYALAFVDIRMPPGWDGIETIKHIWEIDKDIQIVICTAYSDYSWEETIHQLGQHDNLLILKKPFDNVAVRQLASALTKKWKLLHETRQHTAQLTQEIQDRTSSLQKSLSLVKATLESSSDGLLVLNKEEKIVDYNKKFIDMWQIPCSILNSKSEEELINFIKYQTENPEEFIKNWKSIRSHESESDIELIKLKNEKVYECYTQPQILNGAIAGRVMDFRDITARVKLEKELQYQATHDALTGLPNRVILHQHLRDLIKNAKQNNTNFALLFLDLDRFKLINDSLSHAVGDEVLKTAAVRLQMALHPDDILARIGGDEFIIILNNVKNKDEVIEKISNLSDTFLKPFKVDSRDITMTASIGISLFPADGENPDELMRNADAAMYCSKENGGNKVQFYSQEMNKQSLAKLDEEMELRRAITNGEFFLVYQPEFELPNEKLIGLEALIRWQHPEKGVRLPIDFVPLAEETGLIVPIGEWVLRTACAQNKAWQEAGYPSVRVTVNVAANQIKQNNFVELVSNILKQTGLKPEYLELELTENILLSNMEVVNIISELKKLGVKIAVDDFGTGYSSLSYLKKIPLDRLKIDSSLIQHIQSDNDDDVVIRAIITMAKTLNLEILAEGVETQKQLNFLKTNECSDAQGYFFSKPMEVNDLENYFKNPYKLKAM